MSEIIALDTETYWSKKAKYSVRSLLPEHFAAHPLFDCYCVSASDGKTAWAGAPKDFSWEALNGQILISHNARFDQAIVYEMIRRGQIPDFKPAAWHCSSAMSAYLFNRRALADVIEYCYKVKLTKNVRDDSADRHWPADFTAEQQKEMLKYARDDAQWTWRLWNDFSSRWPEHERFIADWHIQRGREGIQIDVNLLNEFILRAHDTKMKIQSLLPWLEDKWDDEDEFNQKPTSTKCIAEECRRCGIPAPPVKSREGEEAFQEWEAEYACAHPWIPALSSWRSVNKLLKTFETMKGRLDGTGVMPFGQKYCGTNTGRVAGESKVNLFNQRKFALLIDERGLMETSDDRINAAHKEKKKTGAWPSWVGGAIDFRNLIIARPGKFLCTSDLSNIEPRVAAHIAGDEAFLDLVRAGHSPYAAHAIASMGWPFDKDLKSEAPETYNLAKMRVLSLGYGASWKKLIVMAQNMGIDLTTDDPETIEETHPYTGEKKTVSGYGATAKRTVREYRDSNPKIVATWRALDDALRRSVGETMTVTLPSGRPLRFEQVRAESRIEPDDEGKPRKRTVYTCNIDGQRSVVYGSLIFAMCCQSTARDIFYEAVHRIENAGIRIVLGVYDEVVCELDDRDQASEVERLMTVAPDWLPNFPLGTETKLLSCYAK